MIFKYFCLFELVILYVVYKKYVVLFMRYFILLIFNKLELVFRVLVIFVGIIRYNEVGIGGGEGCFFFF